MRNSMIATTMLSAVALAPADGATGSVETASEGFLSKLSIKTLGCNGKLGAVASDDKPVPLAQIFGIATGVREKKRVADNGEVIIDTPIVGTFEGVNLQTGEVGKASVLYLPSGMHETLVQALTPVEGQPKPLPVKFGVEIGTRKASNKAGFEYVGKQLLKQAVDNDPLADMRKAIKSNPAASKVKAIEAPKK